MFPGSYFGPRMFPATYWAKVGAAAAGPDPSPVVTVIVRDAPREIIVR